MSAPCHLLIVNPNTSTSVSDLLQRHAQAAAGPDLVVRTVTARFGAPYIACEASYAVAGHALLDAWSAALLDGGPTPQAVLIGCFGDPALQALRESSPVPVCGLAQASFAQAARLGRFVVVTGGVRWAPMLQRLADALGVGPALAGIHTVAPSGAQLAADPVAAAALLVQACQDAVRQTGARAVILGGAGLAGLAARIAPAVEVPVIDSVEAGVAEVLAALHTAPQRPQRAPGFDVRWQHLSPEMTWLGQQDGARPN